MILLWSKVGVKGLGPGTVVKAACMLGNSEVADLSPALAFKLQRNKMFLLCSLVKTQYCGQPP